MSNCPYCQASSTSPASGVRARHPLHQLMGCSSCSKYFVKMVSNGLVYKLVNPANPDSDTISR